MITMNEGVTARNTKQTLYLDLSVSHAELKSQYYTQQPLGWALVEEVYEYVAKSSLEGAYDLEVIVERIDTDPGDMAQMGVLLHGKSFWVGRAMLFLEPRARVVDNTKLIDIGGL